MVLAPDPSVERGIGRVTVVDRIPAQHLGDLTVVAEAGAHGSRMVVRLAFGGELFIPPERSPAWLDGLSQALPTRAGRDLVTAATTGAGLPATVLPVLAAWAAVAGAVAVWAYRRDQGRRFR